MTGTPTPLTLPDGVVLTTLAEAKRCGWEWTWVTYVDAFAGIYAMPENAWRSPDDLYAVSPPYRLVVLARKPPPRTLTIELDEDTGRWVIETQP